MLRNRFFKKNPYKKFGISKTQVKQFRTENRTITRSINFDNVPLTISNPYWFLHSVEEIFIDDIYKFKPNNNEPVIIDCGANWGLSIIYFKKLFPKATIVGFEADPDIYHLLKKNISGFNFSNVQLLNEAVWNKNEKLYFSSDNALGGTIASLGINENNKVEVNAIRFKDFLEQFEKIDFLKIDIEGAEYDLIKDCCNSLNKVENLFLEYHSSPKNEQKLDEILAILKKEGFRYYIKEAWNSMQHPFIASKKLYYDLQLNIFCYRKK